MARPGPLASARLWKPRNHLRSAGVRAGLFVALATGTAVVGYLVRDLIPDRFTDLIGASAAESLLNVLASSLLSVTTFTLGAMVSAYGSAANATPRATPLVIADRTSQNVLSTFVGAFVFSIVGLVMLRTGVYGGGGRVVLFAATVFVIVLVVLVLLRWIARVSHLGLISDSIDRAEHAAGEAFAPWIEHPHLGACAPVALAGAAVEADRVGYVQHVDLGAMQALAARRDLKVHLLAMPGQLVATGDVLARVEGEAPLAELAAMFHIDARRTFDYDPRFALLVLSEVSSKALSPGINDPGTALDVLVRLTRLLDMWARRPHAPRPPAYDRLHAPDLQTGDLFDDAFDATERDGAAMVEVAVRLQLAFAALAASGDAASAAAARRHSARAPARAREGLKHPDDLARVEAAAIAAEGEPA